MLILLSPAKNLDFSSPSHVAAHSKPSFLNEAQQLVEQLRGMSPQALAQLMKISDPLAALNAARYAAWALPFTPANAKQALLAFNGDVYEGLDAASLDVADLEFAQQHVRILSGLYGVLRPLDLMQAYRLEMGTRLANARGKDLYAFWGERIAQALEQARLAAQSKVLLNLASEEYFKAVQPKKLATHLATPVIQPVFEDWSAGHYKIISFYAKRARGLMTRFIVQNRLTEPAQLHQFAAENYAFCAAASDEKRLVFRRKLQ